MRRIKRTTLIAVGACALIVGVAAAKLSLTQLSGSWLYVALVFLPLVFVSRNRPIKILSIVLACFVFGWWSASKTLIRLGDYEDLYGQKVVLEVTADTDGSYDDKTQIAFDASHIQVLDQDGYWLVGRAKIAGFGTSDVRRGDRVEVEGKLFPTIGGKQARMSYAQMKVVERSSSVIEKTRRKFLASLHTVLPEPSASFGIGLLIGQTSDLGKEYVDVLRIVGLSHIVAVSGYNLTIMAEVFNKKFKRGSKFFRLILSLLLINIFVLLAGTSASIARAAVVSMLVAVASYYGRNFKPLVLILLVAAGSALWNPLNLWGDIGWYLSFLAFFGVLVLAPAIQKRFWKKKEPKIMAQIVLSSFCAQAMTLPYIMFVFHQVSLVSLITNMLVLPLIPLAMGLTALAGVVGMIPFLKELGFVLAWPANILLRGILDGSVLFSRVPHASVQIVATLTTMILMYGLVILVAIKFSRSQTSQKTDVKL